MPSKNEMSIVGIALYDTFCGRFHPDEWEELQDAFWKQIEDSQQSVQADFPKACANGIHYTGDEYKVFSFCPDCGKPLR